MKTLQGTIRIGIMFVMLACLFGSFSAAQTPVWDKKIDNANRFKILKQFNNAAVLDDETGLVWERTPDTLSRGTWPYLDGHCATNFIGGRYGWRPPTIVEMLSLMDPTQPDKLPQGHPFDLGLTRSRRFWTISSKNIQPPNNSYASVADFEPGGPEFSDLKIAVTHRFWCVRGGHGYDGNNVP